MIEIVSLALAAAVGLTVGRFVSDNVKAGAKR